MDTESSCHLGKVRLKKDQQWGRKREFGKAISFSLPPSPLYSTKASYWYKGSKPRMRSVLCTALPPLLKPQPEAPVLCPWRSSAQMPFWRHPWAPSQCKNVVSMWIQHAPDCWTVVKSSGIEQLRGWNQSLLLVNCACLGERLHCSRLSFLIYKIRITVEHSSQWYSEDWIKLSKMV